MADHIRLGAFLLETPISSGGMGTVWRGRHQGTETPVAVKVIASTYAQDPIYLDGFEREVRAVARMQHPRIIRVYDFGFVDSAAAKLSDGELPRRSPWLAMELATRGSLAKLPGVGDWPTLKAVLFDVLDALAHSHARKIIHRDLKPGNVLLTDGPDGVRCKLTDFGISHAAGRSMSTREVFATSAGTPWYMAPEQVDSRWRDYGAWTDLYALGCLAYQLASGVTPFVGESAVRVARQQLFDRPPPLEPRFELPPGFSAWIDRLLVKEIQHRFRRAADAAWALHQISPRDSRSIEVRLGDEPPPRLDVGGTDTTQLAGDSSVADQTTDNYDTEVATLTFLDHEPTPTMDMPQLSVPGSLLTFSLPPFPPTWRTTSESEARLPGAGLGLYRLREVPFVGREAERDVIWEALRDVVTNRRPRGVIIRGRVGVGKSRLAWWMAQRAHELGVSSFMHAEHSPVRGSTHGIGSMFEGYLGCGGLDFERSYLRIRRLITMTSVESPDAISYYSAAIARIMHPGARAQGVPAVQFTSADERYEVARRLAESIAARRPLVMVLDDVQWGFDAIAFAQRILESDHPILLLLTVREDQLAERPLEDDALKELEMMNVQSMRIGPLSRREHIDLIDQLLVLEPTLREQVLERTLGSPLFAAELLGDWVRRRVLHAGPTGFRLDSMEEIPDDLHSLWNDRLDRILGNLPNPRAAREAVEVGAALGTTVDAEEWQLACFRLDIDIDDDLVETLIDNALAEPMDGGWAFRHQMLRDSIATAAREADRAHKHHSVIAQILQFDDSADNQLRRALHCLAIEDWEAAGYPLLHAIEGMESAGRRREATAVASLLEDVTARIPRDHPLQPRACQTRLRLVTRDGKADVARDLIARMLPVAEANGWTATLSQLWRAESNLLVEAGDLEAGEEALGHSLDYARQSRDPASIGEVHRSLGWWDVRFGKLESARSHFQTARDHFEMASQSDGISEAIVGLAEAARLAGDHEKARQFNSEAIELSRRHGHRLLLASHLNQRGEIARSVGDYDEAEEIFAEAMNLARLTNSPTTLAVNQLNLGLTILYRGRHEDAAKRLAEAKQRFDDIGSALYVYHASLGLLVCAAAAGDVEAWDAQYPALAAQAAQSVAYRESVEHCIRAGDRWMELDEPARAAQAYELARTLIPEGLEPEFEATLTACLEAAENAPSAPTTR